MLPYIVTAASLLALVVSLYKDRKLEPNTPEVKRALRAHHVAQALLVVLALWAAIDSDNSTKRYRLAVLDAEAAAAASQHVTTIMDIYYLELLPAGTLIRNRDRYQAALRDMPTEARKNHEWSRQVSPATAEQLNSSLRSFEKLQSLARKVLNERVQYAERYPDALVKWAARTLTVEETDLGDLLSNSETGQAYAQLVAQATGVSRASYRDAVKRLEE